MSTSHPYRSRPGYSRAAGMVTILLLGLFAGCEDSSTGSEPSPVGTWILVGVADEDLPVTFDAEQNELVAGDLVIRGDGTCEQGFELRAPSGETSPQSFFCTWERTGNTLELERPGGGPRATALLEGRRMRMDPENFATLWYER